MSTNGVVMIAEAVHRIVMVLKNDAFTKEEMLKLKKIIETLQRIADKTLADGLQGKEQFSTIQMVEGEAIKCGDALHYYRSEISGALCCRLMDAEHEANAVAVENLTGPEGEIDLGTGQVRNVKGGDDVQPT